MVNCMSWTFSHCPGRLRNSRAISDSKGKRGSCKRYTTTAATFDLGTGCREDPSAGHQPRRLHDHRRLRLVLVVDCCGCSKSGHGRIVTQPALAPPLPLLFGILARTTEYEAYATLFESVSGINPVISERLTLRFCHSAGSRVPS